MSQRLVVVAPLLWLAFALSARSQTPPPRLNGVVTFYFTHLPESAPIAPETVTCWLMDGGARKAVMGTVSVKPGDVEIQMSAAVPADEFFSHALSAQAVSASGDWYTQLLYKVRIPQWAAQPIGRRRPSHPPVPKPVVRRKRTVLPPVEAFPYFTVLDAMPNVNRLHAGDRVYRMTDGKFIVTASGFGLANMPPSGSVQVWP